MGQSITCSGSRRILCESPKLADSSQENSSLFLSKSYSLPNFQPAEIIILIAHLMSSHVEFPVVLARNAGFQSEITLSHHFDDGYTIPFHYHAGATAVCCDRGWEGGARHHQKWVANPAEW